ncbi:uncharacterized protein LOC144450761 [Glandiceps talaboti]
MGHGCSTGIANNVIEVKDETAVASGTGAGSNLYADRISHGGSLITIQDFDSDDELEDIFNYRKAKTKRRDGDEDDEEREKRENAQINEAASKKGKPKRPILQRHERSHSVESDGGEAYTSDVEDIDMMKDSRSSSMTSLNLAS